MIKKTFLAPILYTFLFGAIVSCTKSDQDYNKAVVVKVNQKELTTLEFSNRLLRRIKHLDALNVKEENTIKKAKNEVVSDFILQSLVEQFAAENKIVVKTEQLKERINKLQSGYPDEFAFQEALVENDIDFDEWQADVRSSLLQEEVFKTIKKDVPEPDIKELKSYYNDHKDDFKTDTSFKLQQIVLATEGDARVVLDHLKKGKDFGELAKKFSIAPEAKNNGELGWVEKGTFEAFDKVEKLRVNRYSDMIKSHVGFHIIKLLGKKRAQTKSFKDSQSEIKHLLLEKKHKVALIQWFENQVRSAKVLKDQKLIDAIDVVTQE